MDNDSLLSCLGSGFVFLGPKSKLIFILFTKIMELPLFYIFHSFPRIWGGRTRLPNICHHRLNRNKLYHKLSDSSPIFYFSSLDILECIPLFIWINPLFVAPVCMYVNVEKPILNLWSNQDGGLYTVVLKGGLLNSV